MSSFTISSMSDFERPIDRVRQDRRYVELERTAMPEPWLRVIGNTAGFIVFLAACIALMWL